MPGLGAFANGCPASLSDRSCFPEGSVHFNTRTPFQLKAILMRVLGDRQLPHKMTGMARHCREITEGGK